MIAELGKTKDKEMILKEAGGKWHIIRRETAVR